MSRADVRYVHAGTVRLLRVELAFAMGCLAGCARTTSINAGEHPATSSAGAGRGDVAAAGSSTGAGHGDAADAGSSNAPAATPCTSGDPFALLRCDFSRVAGVAWGDAITVQRGSGPPPEPAGGVVAAGGYQLVAETLYGEGSPAEISDRVGDVLQRTLAVDCDVVNEAHQQVSTLSDVRSIGTGNDCHRLVPDALPLIELSGFYVSDGPPIPDARQQVAYTAQGPKLTLLYVMLYQDLGAPVLGSYTRVEEFILVSSDASAAAGSSSKPVQASQADAGETSKPRDPRCPAQPPRDGKSCTPDPAPLECEYGGDAWTRCTTFARCELDRDGSFHFRIVDPTPCTPPNPADCPPTFAEAMALVVTNDAGVPAHDAGAGAAPSESACNYDEGVCGCGIEGAMSDRAGCGWLCRNGANVGKDGSAGCPWPRALAGDACSAGLECDYDTACHGSATIGPSMICQNGHWATFGGVWHGCP